jgi:hypothetical protein
MKTTLDHALEYFRKDFSVIPIVPRGKKPAIQSWESNKTIRADETQIVQWFSNSQCNVAIVTGRISRILTFDIDGNVAKEQFNQIVEGLYNDDDGAIIKTAIKNTMSIKTGGGNTNVIVGFNPEDFFSDGQEIIKNAVLWRSNNNGNGNDDGLHSEIRLKGEGGYIVAPPSIHPNGNKYELINGSSPVVLSKEQIRTLIAAFNDGSRKDKAPSTKNTEAYKLENKAVSSIVSILKPYYPVGARNDFILYLSGWLRKEGVTIESACKVIEGLVNRDEEKQSRLRTLQETYAKDNLSSIKGYSGLLTLLSEQLEDEQKAHQILKRVEGILLPVTTEKKKKKEEEKEEKEDILDLVKKNCLEFFIDQHGSPYAAIKVNDHIEAMYLHGRRFKNWLCKRYYDATNRLLGSESLTSVLNILKAEAEFGDNIEKLHLRVARNDREPYTIYYDLTNSKWEVVKITDESWSIEKSPPTILAHRNLIISIYMYDMCR